MASRRQEFWSHESYALVGDTRAGRAFPKITLEGLVKMGKTVYAVDPGGVDLGGTTVYPDLASLPAKVEAAVLEVPKQETSAWVGKVADAGIGDVWIHQHTDTPEALALAQERGLQTCHGTCAVMYVKPGFSPHAVHRGIMKLVGKY